MLSHHPRKMKCEKEILTSVVKGFACIWKRTEILNSSVVLLPFLAVKMQNNGIL